MIFFILKLILITVIINGYGMRNNYHENRIMGGNVTDISKYQYLVCIVLLKSFSKKKVDEPFCGGSIIRRYWVLTAAHCIRRRLLFDKDLRKDALVVRGNTSCCSTGQHSIDHIIKLYMLHPQYSYTRGDGDYDIGLLKVKQPFYGLYEKIIELVPSGYKYTINETVFAMGWGLTVDNLPVTNKLHEVSLRIIGYDECRRMYQLSTNVRKVTRRMFCAGWRGGGKDSCHGDSGGPLVTTKHLQIGIVSWGFPGCEGIIPGVYVRLPLFIEWINKEIKKERHNRNVRLS